MAAVDLLIEERKSRIASVRSCILCKFTEVLRCGRPGVGRGYGMREGNKARGRMIQHVKAAHPRECTAVFADYDSFRKLSLAERAAVLRRMFSEEKK